MSLWLVRAGRHGQHEDQFLEDGRIYMTWGGVDTNLAVVQDREDVRNILREKLPTASEGKINNGSGQIWAFVRRMQPGDWVVLPSKRSPVVHIAEIKGEYEYSATTDRPHHSRKVEWIATDIPRSNFDQDLLYSFGAFMTICGIKRNNAKARVRAMAKHGWKTSPVVPQEPTDAVDDEVPGEDAAPVDLERLARDQIAKVISRSFRGHDLARLVDEVLQAQGYTTYRSPEGPDKGIDILAAPGPLGFGHPRICIQVKSSDTPVDRQTLDQLVGTMQKVQADQGLLVSWGGFKKSVERERATQFFQVRLWDQDTLIEELLDSYENLSDSFAAELPLKRIWAVAFQEEGEDEG